MLTKFLEHFEWIQLNKWHLITTITIQLKEKQLDSLKTYVLENCFQR